ncbi:MFS general substrate transporter [Serendipita vermifera]|nr:MFS general substrate transporter [Serendipita vermifera]
MSHFPLEISKDFIGDVRRGAREVKAFTSAHSIKENYADGTSTKNAEPNSRHLEVPIASFSINGVSDIRGSMEITTSVPLPESTSTIFLQNIRSSETSDAPLANDQDVTTNVSSLAPVDGGIGAWSYLFAAFFVEIIVLGFPNTYGVFLDAYLRDPTYSSQPRAYFLLPLIASFCVKEFYMDLEDTAIIYYVCLSYMSEWFVVRRGLANGVINAAGALSGLILPLVLPGLLEKHGISKTLRMLTVFLSALLVPLLPFVRGRLPPSKIQGPLSHRGDGSRAWMKQRKFHFLILINTIQGLGYFVPFVWLPTFASAMNLSPSKASLALAMLNGKKSVNHTRYEVLIYVHRCRTFSTLLGTCIATFIIWSVLGHSLAGLIAFGVVYGSFAGGWTSMWTGFVRQIVHEDPMLSTNLLSYLMLSRGLGNILSTPISTALSSPHAGRRRHERFGFDVGSGRFENVILYAGSCFAAAAVIASIGWGFDRSTLRQLRSS